MAALNEAYSQLWSGAQNGICLPLNRGGQMKDLVANITSDPITAAIARRHGLQISNVAWEDTGRTKGSCFGPNISDMTLCVDGRNMPIIRKPNFADLTSDQNIDSFTVNVGNEKGGSLRAITLKEYLTDINKYTDVKVDGSLYSDRDTKVLTAAQACVLPLKGGKVEFGVKLYNYQSRSAPAVLVIVAGSQGTSAHVVLGSDNILDFNKNGLKAKFLAERLRDDRARRGVALDGPMTQEEKLRNALLIFQIPLQYNVPRQHYVEAYNYTNEDEEEEAGGCCSDSESWGNAQINLVSQGFRSAGSCTEMSSHYDGKPMKALYNPNKRNESTTKRSSARGMDHAVLSTTEGNGKYPSLAQWTMKRDSRMPIRCTIQYYHVTDTNTIDETSMEQIAGEVVRHGPVGSLVVGGRTERPTEHNIPNKITNIIGGLFSGL